MTEFLNLAYALHTIYTYIFWRISDEDFMPLTGDFSIKLPMSEREKKWYVVNPFKLSKVTKTKLIVDEHDKKELLSATRLICLISQGLHESASFRERLLYCKIFLPPCVSTQNSEAL